MKLLSQESIVGYIQLVVRYNFQFQLSNFRFNLLSIFWSNGLLRCRGFELALLRGQISFLVLIVSAG